MATADIESYARLEVNDQVGTAIAEVHEWCDIFAWMPSVTIVSLMQVARRVTGVIDVMSMAMAIMVAVVVVLILTDMAALPAVVTIIVVAIVTFSGQRN